MKNVIFIQISGLVSHSAVLCLQTSGFVRESSSSERKKKGRKGNQPEI